MHSNAQQQTSSKQHHACEDARRQQARKVNGMHMKPAADVVALTVSTGASVPPNIRYVPDRWIEQQQCINFVDVAYWSIGQWIVEADLHTVTCAGCGRVLAGNVTSADIPDARQTHMELLRRRDSPDM